jgi:hypothetical protein
MVWTPRNLTNKLTPSIPLSFQREGEAVGGGEFTQRDTLQALPRNSRGQTNSTSYT